MMLASCAVAAAFVLFWICAGSGDFTGSLTFALRASFEGIFSFLPMLSLLGSMMSFAVMSAVGVVLNLCAILSSVSPFTTV